MNFEDSVLGMETGLGMSSLTPMIRQRAKPVIGDGNLVYDEDWSVCRNPPIRGISVQPVQRRLRSQRAT